jgi:hypothetical protein
MTEILNQSNTQDSHFICEVRLLIICTFFPHFIYYSVCSFQNSETDSTDRTSTEISSPELLQLTQQIVNATRYYRVKKCGFSFDLTDEQITREQIQQIGSSLDTLNNVFDHVFNLILSSEDHPSVLKVNKSAEKFKNAKGTIETWHSNYNPPIKTNDSTDIQNVCSVSRVKRKVDEISDDMQPAEIMTTRQRKVVQFEEKVEFLGVRNTRLSIQTINYCLNDVSVVVAQHSEV